MVTTTGGSLRITLTNEKMNGLNYTGGSELIVFGMRVGLVGEECGGSWDVSDCVRMQRR